MRLAKSHQNVLRAALEEIGEARRRHDAQLEGLRAARDRALDELVELSLPALSREALASVPRFTGYRQFEADDPLARMERRRQELSSRVVRIEADEKYQRREQLLDPAAGDLTLRLAEAEKELKIMAEAVGRYEGEPEFLGLVERGYDTERYSFRWWQPQYYRDWKHGDLIAESFGAQTFREVLDAYTRVKAGYDEFRQDHDTVRQRVAEVEALVAGRAECLSGLENIEADTLNACRRQLREHLEYIDRKDLASWSAPDPQRIGLIKRLHGIEKKMEYLDELARRYLDPEREQLARAVAKTGKKVDKYSRPKNAYAVIPVAEANRALADPTPRLRERRRRYDDSYQSVLVFDRYDAYDYASDMLWWDVITDGRMDGDFIPEVRAWRDEHQGVRDVYDRGGAGTDLAPTGGAGGFTDVS